MKCGEPLAISKSNSNRGQLTRCIKCYRKEWYAKNREKVIDNSKRYYRATAPKRRKLARDFWNALPQSEQKRRSRIQALRRKYGITVEDYDRMFAEQKGLCFLCNLPPKKGRPLSVDHAHLTKTVRKLLCDQCNRALGFIERDLSWVDRALQYLKT